MKRKILALILAVVSVVSLIAVPASAAADAPTVPGIYDVKPLAMNAKLTPQLADNTPVGKTTAVVDGVEQDFYPNAVRFAMEFQGTPNQMYFLIVCSGDLSSVDFTQRKYVNQYTADAAGAVSAQGTGSPYFDMEPGVYSVFANGTKLATFRCGNAEKPLFRIWATSMSLGNTLEMRFLFDEANLDGRTDVKAVITKTYADGRAPLVVEVPYEKWTTKWGKRCVTFNNIAAKEMMDGMAFQIVTNDNVPLSRPYTETIHNNALRQLKNSSTNPKLRTLLVDMLNYGAAAQKEFKYDEGNLANADIGAYQQFATQTVTMESHAGRTHGDGHYSTSLSLNSNIRMTMYFQKITTDMHAVVSFVNHAGRTVELTIPGSQFRSKWGMHGIEIDALAVADVRTLVKCEIYDAQNNLMQGGVDSVEGCAARAKGTGQKDIYDAIPKFGTSSDNYLNNK